jgi:hypothetical protein
MPHQRSRKPPLAAYAWAAPCSLIGLLLALPLRAAGARARVAAGVLEVAFASPQGLKRKWLARLPFRAITFGHVVLGVSHRELARLRIHEHAHVRQYERWGALFLLAYPLSSLWQLLRGRPAYRSNHFEVGARAHESRVGDDAR